VFGEYCEKRHGFDFPGRGGGMRQLVFFVTIFVLCSIWLTGCAAPRPCVDVDSYNRFQYDVYRALDSIRHGEYDDAWRMK